MSDETPNVPPPGDNTRRRQIARAAGLVGDLAWWLFVVSSLIAGGVNWWSPRYPGSVSFSDSIRVYCMDTSPLGSENAESRCLFNTSGFGADNLFADLALCSIVGIVVAVLAAAVQSWATGLLVPGVLNVAVPLIGYVLFLAATPGGFGGQWMRPVVALVIIFVAVVLREMWARRFRTRYLQA
ncbi:hypothetical protein QSJ19_24685 [Gordonia sp. ABSL11-1]|uniref:hypothetical protein n=1 Tax=Gordonia sp. ABSL11-1 TaxID=3053924 RepID=UPI0025746660|nr:hypothetical protein [Gordonia sp. ABSL11-1]MDL9948724.1 hypothetical protein [Gordonia sp. ABSL11-1]